VRILAPESQLLFLCIHGSKHLWVTLKWICDVARLVEVSPQMNLEATVEQARRLGIERAVLLGLLLSAELLDTRLPSEVQRQIQSDVIVKRHAAQVMRRLFERRPEPASLELTLFNARMSHNRWHKIRHVAALLKAPTEGDAQLLHLPTMLFPLYYPFRFCRMVLKYVLLLIARALAAVSRRN
jgi:hypothetical protein